MFIVLKNNELETQSALVIINYNGMSPTNEEIQDANQ